VRVLRLGSFEVSVDDSLLLYWGKKKYDYSYLLMQEFDVCLPFLMSLILVLFLIYPLSS